MNKYYMIYSLGNKGADDKGTILYNFNSEQFGLLMGVYNSMLYAPMTLLVGGFTDKVNRKNLILSSCFVGGFFTLANAFVSDIKLIIALRITMGFLSSLFQPASYSIINDYFPPSARTKAFFIY